MGDCRERGTNERKEPTESKRRIAKNVTARLARSDPQARTINKWRQTPNKKSGERSEHLIGVWGDEVATGEEGE